MKARELMIGDWVVYNGDVDYYSPIKIEGMDEAIDMLITNDREDVGFDGILPIPLSEKSWTEISSQATMREIIHMQSRHTT